MYVGFHVKCPLFLSDFKKLEFFRQISEKYSNIKIHKNVPSGSRIVPCRRTNGRMDGQTDMMKLIVAYQSFTNAPEKRRARWPKRQCFPSCISRHLLRIQGRAPIILSEVVRDFPQTLYSTVKYLITVSFLALSNLPNPIILHIIQNTITAAAVMPLDNLRLSKYFMKFSHSKTCHLQKFYSQDY